MSNDNIDKGLVITFQKYLMEKSSIKGEQTKTAKQLNLIGQMYSMN